MAPGPLIPVISEEELKEFKREFGLNSLISNTDYKFIPNFNNLIKYNTDKITRRKSKWGFLPIGDKYDVYDFYKDSNHYKLIKLLSRKYDFIVTGSTALRIFGVLDRKPARDLDLIASDETIQKMKDDKDLKDYKYFQGIYGESDRIRDLNLKVSFTVDEFSYKIDMFTRDDVDYETLDGIKIAKPFDVMGMKLNAGRRKDMFDCRDFMKLIKKNNKIKKLVTNEQSEEIIKRN